MEFGQRNLKLSKPDYSIEACSYFNARRTEISVAKIYWGDDSNVRWRHVYDSDSGHKMGQEMRGARILTL